MAEIVDFGLQKHKIKMDGKFFENNLFAVAGDTGRRLEVQLLDSDNLVQNTTGISLRLNADVAGQATYAEATLVDAAKGLYELDLPNGMLIAPGNWQFQWQITDSVGKKLHSFAFTGSVGSNLSEGGSEATNFYLNAEELRLKTIELQSDFDKLGDQFKILIDETTGKDVISAPEIIAARKGEASLNARLTKNEQETTAQFQQNENFRTAPYILYSNLMKKLNRGESAEIGCVGDSLTAGADATNGVIRTITADDGTTQELKSVAKTYPIVLRDLLREIYKNETINVKNFGWSGATVKDSLEKWTINRNLDLAIIMLGTNDSNNSLAIETYIEDIDKLVRRYLEFGTAVILATPPLRQNRNKYWRMNPYRIALMEYAKTNNIFCVDMTEETSNFSSYSYSDATHFTALGYAEIARSFASILTGYGATRPTVVGNGSYLQVNDDIVNLVSRSVLIEDVKFPGAASQVGLTPQSLQIKPGEKFYLAVYASQENLVMFPNVEFLGDNSKLSIVVSGTLAKNLSNAYIGVANEDATKKRGRVAYTFDKSFANYKNNTVINIENVNTTSTLLPVIILPNKGWHLIELSNTGTTATNLFGFEFLSTLLYRVVTGRAMNLF